LCVCQVLEWNSWEAVSGNKTPMFDGQTAARFVLQSQPLFPVFSFCLYASVTLASIAADLELDSSWPTGGSSSWGSSPRSSHRAVPSRTVTWVGPACLIPVNNPRNNHASGRERGNTDEGRWVSSGRGFIRDCTTLRARSLIYTHIPEVHFKLGDRY
jgi:hypothetical protein